MIAVGLLALVSIIAGGAVSGVRAALPRRAAGVPEGAAVHRTTTSRRRGRRSGSTRSQPPVAAAGTAPSRPTEVQQQRRHDLEHPAVAAGRPEGELRVAAADPAVLRVQRRRRRPVHRSTGERRVRDDLGARGEPGRRSRGRRHVAEHSTSSTRTGSARWRPQVNTATAEGAAGLHPPATSRRTGEPRSRATASASTTARGRRARLVRRGRHGHRGARLPGNRRPTTRSQATFAYDGQRRHPDRAACSSARCSRGASATSTC